MVWLMFLQSPWMVGKKNTVFVIEGAEEENGVPLMNNLSVDFWVTLWGLNQGVAVMFFCKRGLSGGTTQKRTAVWASCPVELSLYSGLATHQSVSSFLPEAWAETISRDLWFLDISNGLIVAANARSIASPVRPRMNQYPGVNRYISASLSKTFMWHFSMLHLTGSDRPVWNSQHWEFWSFRKSPQPLP